MVIPVLKRIGTFRAGLQKEENTINHPVSSAVEVLSGSSTLHDVSTQLSPLVESMA